MNNSIRNVSMVSSWDPAKADVLVAVATQYATPTTEVRGRLIGPHCRYSTTVEVAYPLRNVFGRPAMLGSFPRGHILLRAVIPEPSVWEPECPFVYDVLIELWQDGERCDQSQVRHALRRMQLKRQGLLLNGRPFALRGLQRNACSDEDAHRFRQRGCNLLLADVTVGCAHLWDRAESFGFLMIGRLSSIDEETIQHLHLFLDQPGEQTSTFGWLFPQKMVENHEAWQKVLHTIYHKNKRSIGVEIKHVPKQPLPQEIGYVACSADLLPSLDGLSMPKIVLGTLPEVGVTPREKILGWVE